MHIDRTLGLYKQSLWILNKFKHKNRQGPKFEISEMWSFLHENVNTNFGASIKPDSKKSTFNLIERSTISWSIGIIFSFIFVSKLEIDIQLKHMKL